MIIWLASYPKSGNTYVRAFLSAYYFSKDGQFEFGQISNIRSILANYPSYPTEPWSLRGIAVQGNRKLHG